MSEQNPIPVSQPPIQTPMPIPEPLQETMLNKPAHSGKNGGQVWQIVLAIIAILALLLGVVANLRISLDTAGAESKTVGSSNVQSMRKTNSGKTESMKKAGTQTGFKTIEFAPKEGSQLEWDTSEYYPYKAHLKLVKLEVKGNKATLTSEVTNNDEDSNDPVFAFTSFQNGMQTGTGSISPEGRIQSGYTATVTTEFDIKDSSQPVTLEFEEVSQKIQIEFDPVN